MAVNLAAGTVFRFNMETNFASCAGGGPAISGAFARSGRKRNVENAKSMIEPPGTSPHSIGTSPATFRPIINNELAAVEGRRRRGGGRLSGARGPCESENMKFRMKKASAFTTTRHEAELDLTPPLPFVRSRFCPRSGMGFGPRDAEGLP